MNITIAAETPLSGEVRALVAALDRALLALTPPEHCFHISAEQMAGDETTVFVAREGGAAIAMGALRRHGGGVGEVKRMYTVPEWQGRGVGGLVVAEIERLARAEGVRRLVLETGDRHPAAWRVYERAGFVRCEAVLDYPESVWSVFYEKVLDAGSSA